MRGYLILAVATLTLCRVCLTSAGDDPAAPRPAKAAAQAQQDATKASDAPRKAPEKTPVAAEQAATPKEHKTAIAKETPVVPAKYAADEKAIRDVHQALIQAYSSDDAKSVAAHFTADAEYINTQGALFEGRKEIEDSLTETMTEHPGCKLEAEIDGIRFISPGVALVDATVTVKHAESEQIAPTVCHSAIVYLKADGQWQIGSVRDQHAPTMPVREERLAQLNFLIGEWVDEHEHSILSFSCRPDQSGKFLLRDFTLKLDGQDVLTGTQRIGWDPVSDTLRTWIFDSEGGFAEGIWQQTDDGWTVKTAGVTGDGEIATGSSLYTIVNDHTMTWQAVDHEVDGVHVSDSPVFTLTHQPPKPSVEAEPKVGQKE